MRFFFFLLAELLKTLILILKKPTKAIKLHKPNNCNVNDQRGWQRGKWECHLRKGIVSLVMCFPWLLFIPIRVALVAVPAASLDNNMHTLIWQMCRVSGHVQCTQVKLGVFLFLISFSFWFSWGYKLRNDLLTCVVTRVVFEVIFEGCVLLWGASVVL